MLKRNQWTLGERHFQMPPMPEGMRGVQGCSLHFAVFDPAVGEEVYLLFREEPGYAENYAEVKPLTMLATTGMVRTPHGLAAFIVWQVAVGTPHQIALDHYVNPNDMGALRLLSAAGNQTHFKLVIINSMTSAVTAFIDFENTFELGEFAAAMTTLIGHEEVGDFPAASAYVMDHMSVEDLLNLTPGN